MVHVEHRRSFELEASVERVLPLFTPAGERLWVEGWDPEFLHPKDGETCEGMVFRTRHGGETTLWGCVEWNPQAGRVRYARVTPDSRFGFVEVSCRRLAPARTQVEVAYAMTALAPTGEEVLDAMTADAFAAMVETWRERTSRRLRAGA